MPLPRRRSGESHDDFTSRCHEAISGEFPDQKQRHAVCESQWRKGAKASAAPDWFQMQTLEAPDGSDAEAVLELTINGPIGGMFGEDYVTQIADHQGPIHLRINSPGGSALDGLAIYNLLLDREVTVEVMGLAASAASVIAMAGKEISVRKNAFLMIHQASSFSYGRADELREAASVLDRINEMALDIYAERSGLSREGVDLLLDSGDFWMDGEAAKTLGFADKVLSERRSAVTRGWVDQFTNVPVQLLEKAPTSARSKGADDMATKEHSNPAKTVAAAIGDVLGTAPVDQSTDPVQDVEEILTLCQIAGRPDLGTQVVKARIETADGTERRLTVPEVRAFLIDLGARRAGPEISPVLTNALDGTTPLDPADSAKETKEAELETKFGKAKPWGDIIEMKNRSKTWRA